MRKYGFVVENHGRELHYTDLKSCKTYSGERLPRLARAEYLVDRWDKRWAWRMIRKAVTENRKKMSSMEKLKDRLLGLGVGMQVNDGVVTYKVLVRNGTKIVMLTGNQIPKEARLDAIRERLRMNRQCYELAQEQGCNERAPKEHENENWNHPWANGLGM